MRSAQSCDRAAYQLIDTAIIRRNFFSKLWRYSHRQYGITTVRQITDNGQLSIFYNALIYISHPGVFINE